MKNYTGRWGSTVSSDRSIYEKENSEKKTSAEVGCAGPMETWVLNVSTTHYALMKWSIQNLNVVVLHLWAARRMEGRALCLERAHPKLLCWAEKIKPGQQLPKRDVEK